VREIGKQKDRRKRSGEKERERKRTEKCIRLVEMKAVEKRNEMKNNK